MKKMDASRRRFLTGTATAAGIAMGAGLVSSAGLAFGKGSGFEPGARRISYAGYKPAYFTDPEWRFLVAACDLLIPADEVGPGALDANVPVFIDKQMQTDYAVGGLWYMHAPFLTNSAPEFGYQYKFTPREIYRIGIAEVDSFCEKTYGKPFPELDRNRQTAVLKGLENGSIDLGTVPAQVLFSQLLANTKEGFFADPMYGGNRDMVGWKMIGFPGARGDYGTFIHEYDKPYPWGPVSIEGQEG